MNNVLCAPPFMNDVSYHDRYEADNIFSALDDFPLGKRSWK